jgi:hypothetical protein
MPWRVPPGPSATCAGLRCYVLVAPNAANELVAGETAKRAGRAI